MIATSLTPWVRRLNRFSGDVVEPNLQRHVPALDALRGLAIAAVTLYRFGGGSEGAASAGDHALPGVALGMRGVDLFFVLSGFLITGILFDAREKPHFFTNFYARRTLRIFPLYYGILLVTLLLLPAWFGRTASFADAHDHAAWLWLYGANLLQSLRGEWCLGYLNHFWSLAVEEHFYLVWPAVIYALSRRQAMIACCLLFAGATIGRVAWLVFGGNDVAPEVFTLFRLDGLVAGAWLALAARGPGGISRYASTAKALGWLAALLLIPITLSGMRLLTLVDTIWITVCCSLLVQLVIAAKDTAWGKIAASPLLHWLGKYSYGMYVFANLLIPLVATIVTARDLAAMLGSSVLGQLAYLAMMTALTAGAALLSWHLFEKHFLRLKRYFEH
jgi:peptidoglycan/LPS O-acetylase OafA/YrhL